MTKIVAIENLNYSYQKEHQILENINLDIGANEVFVLLGHNGAGKTTLLRLMLNFIKNYDGRIALFEKSPEDPASRSRVGFMSEQPVIYDYEDAEGYLRYFAQLAGVSASAEKIEELLQLTGLVQHRHKKLSQYSKGMLQRLNLCRSLLNDPSLLIMDEPIIGLDPLGQELIERVVRIRKEQGHSVFINTHSISFAAKVADRVGFLMGGHLKHVFPRSEFSGTAEILEKAFLEYSADLSLEDKAR